MNTIANLPPNTASDDADLTAQARPGHGVPSQDPDPSAQSPLTAKEAEREPKSMLVGGGMVAGAATGAAMGVAVAGPVGAVVGGTLGAVAGALGGAAVGAAMNADEPSRAVAASSDGPRVSTDNSDGVAIPVAPGLLRPAA